MGKIHWVIVVLDTIYIPTIFSATIHTPLHCIELGTPTMIPYQQYIKHSRYFNSNTRYYCVNIYIYK